MPNADYSGGSLVHGRTQLLPYAIADNAMTFATVQLNALIAAMA